KVSIDGKYHALHDAQMRPAPAPVPALLIGGGGERRTLRLVAKYADEWNAPALPAGPDAAKCAVLEQHCAANKRDPATITRSMMCAFIAGRDDTELERRAVSLQQVLPQLAQMPVPALLETVRGRGWLVGTPAQIVEQLQALAASGVQRVMLQHHNQ